MPPSTARASEPCVSSSPMGVTTLPLDFDIFLRSGSRIQPEIAACFHGSTSCSSCERTTVENSHVRMMSCPWGRRSMGKVRANRSASSRHPHTICGVSDEVAHVSMMSFSPVKPPGTSRCDSSKPGAGSADGSTGSDASDGTIGESHTISPERIQRVPHGNRHAEESLARDQPVAGQPKHPILVALAHVRRAQSRAPRRAQRARRARRHRAHRCGCTTGAR